MAMCHTPLALAIALEVTASVRLRLHGDPTLRQVDPPHALVAIKK